MALRLPEKNAPRVLVFAADLLICVFSLLLAYLIRFDFLSVPKEELAVLRPAIPAYIGVRALFLLVFRTYRGMIRYTSTQDVRRIFFATAAGTVVFLIISPLRKEFLDGFYFLPISILLIEFLNSLFFMVTGRMIVKMIFLEGRRRHAPVKRVVIFGAGESGIITKRTLDRDSELMQRTVAFVDDDASKRGKSLEGAPIYGTDRLEELLATQRVDQLIISIQQPDAEKKRKVIETAMAAGVEVMNVPPVSSWIGGQLSSGQIRKVRIEDLLGRKPIVLHHQQIGSAIGGKVVLVTGASGSIGSGLVKAIIAFSPERIVLLDQAESPLYDLETELMAGGFSGRFEVVVGDITNAHRMRRLFEAFRPAIVFHAAAYKHVPMMELNPTEAVRTNTGGTMILADLSREFGVEKFVMVSTDKAVNPTNVMGASKRIAEIYAQSANALGPTHFVTTRFGNVLGSNGSVIPLFRRQIEQGGPVTVTHPDVTRFFMTIPEACQLVIEAGVMGQGGEIFLFDMGDSVRIADLAEKMIRLSGLEPGKDIEIKFTGLRPGEKLFEELLADRENTLPTHHQQIMKARVREYDYAVVEPLIRKLVSLCDMQDNDALVKAMKDLVPEYVSNNSEFEKFDRKKV